MGYKKKKHGGFFCNLPDDVQFVVVSCVFLNDIWATASIYNDEDKMWRQAGFVEMLVSPAKRDQNKMGGLQKRGRFKTF